MTILHTAVLRACAARRTLPFLLLAGTLALTACGGDAGDDNTPPSVDVNGTWNVTEVATSNCAGEEHTTVHYQATVTQDATTLHVQTPAGRFDGTIHGLTLSWSGSYAEPHGGTTTIQHLELTANAAGSSFTGGSTWSWTNGAQSCSGTTQTSGTKA